MVNHGAGIPSILWLWCGNHEEGTCHLFIKHEIAERTCNTIFKWLGITYLSWNLINDICSWIGDLHMSTNGKLRGYGSNCDDYLEGAIIILELYGVNLVIKTKERYNILFYS